MEEKPTLQRSYEVAYQIAKCKKTHTIAEELIKPCAENMVEIIIRSGAKKKTRVSLSNDTIHRRIDDIVANVCQQVCFKIKESTLQASIQLDGSTKRALESHLIVFARYEKDKKMESSCLAIHCC